MDVRQCIDYQLMSSADGILEKWSWKNEVCISQSGVLNLRLIYYREKSLFVIIFFSRFAFSNEGFCMGIVDNEKLKIDELTFKTLFDEFYQDLCVFASTYLKDDSLSADIVQ